MNRGIRLAMKILPAVASFCLVACGSVPGTGDAGIPRTGLTGALAFDAGLALVSTQTAGGGAVEGDNLTVTISACMSGLSDRTVWIELHTRDHSRVTTGGIPIEVPNAANGGNLFALLDYRDTRPGFVSYSAKSGTVTMDTIDLDNLSNNAGHFEAVIDLNDGGISALAGRFDANGQCH